MTMFSSSVSFCVPCSFSQKLFLFLLPVTMTLFATQHIATATASPFNQQKEDAVAVPVPMPFSGQFQPPFSLDSDYRPTYFVYSATERPIYYDQNDAAAIEDELGAEEAKAKRAQTFVRFGKRAQTFVRFGKRAQTFVRFGRDAQRQQRQFAGKMENEQQKKE